MKSLLIRFTAIFAAMLCMFTSIDFKAFADEMEKTFTVNFKIANVCNYEKDSFTVRLDDIGSDFYEELEISCENNKVSSYVIAAPTTYTITLEGLDEGYLIYDYTTCKPFDDKFAATNNGEKTFTWEILREDQVNEPSETEETADSEEKTVINDGSVVKVKLGDTYFDSETIYNEFLELYEKYYYDEEVWDGLNHMKWKSRFGAANYPHKKDKFDTHPERRFTKIYVASRKHDGMTDEELEAEFLSMTDYEMSVWVMTYLAFTECIYEGKPDKMKDTLFVDIVHDGWRLMGDDSYSDNHKDLVEVYINLLYWQKYYIEEYNVPFNFIDGCSYSESIGLNAPVGSEREEASESEEVISEDEEIAEIQDEIMDEMTDEEKKEVEEAVADIQDGDDSEKGNMVPIVIVIIVVALIGAGGLIFVKKKQK